MCTLTFRNQNGNIIITSNRDEHINRGISNFPVSQTIDNIKIVFPQDPQAGGTWLACSEKGQIRVLLNGAFVRHKHQPPYRKSRGIVLLESYKSHTLKEFQNNYDLDGIEPFTLVHFDLSNKNVEELRWDGNHASHKTFDHTLPHIWSSATLYSPEVIKQRETWFKEWIKNEENTAKSMLNFHHFGGDHSNENSITMSRGSFLKTVSISQITQTDKLNFHHHILLNDSKKSFSF